MSQKFVISNAFRRPVSDEELLEDLKRVCDSLKKSSVTFRQYNASGAYSAATMVERFRSWNEALVRAGLIVGQTKNYSDDELFGNLARTWSILGRQPHLRDLSKLPSTISSGPYQRRFGSWIECLEAFVVWAEANDEHQSYETENESTEPGPRSPSLRLRFRVLTRDAFRCVTCGKSPAVTIGTILYVDHIVPWSKGGRTEDAKLRTLCSDCNLGRSNVL